MKKLALLVVCASVLTAAAALRSITLAPQGGDWWSKRHAEKMKLVQAGGERIVFLGDSITHFWEGAGKDVWKKYFAQGRYKALNLGFSADRTEHVLWRIANGEFDGYEAKAVVLMIGTNNAGHFPFAEEPPEDTIVGVKAILGALRAKQPKAKIVLCSIFPRGAKPSDPIRLRNESVNKEIAKFANGRDVLWCDFGGQFLAPDGTLPAEVMPDRLHPAAYGYEVWASAVLPFLDYALDAKDGDGRLFPNRFAASASPSRFALEGPMEAQPQSFFPNVMWWGKGRPEQKRAEIVDGPKAYDVVFVGDSITHRWEYDNPGGNGLPVWQELKKTYALLDIGYGGDQTQHVIWRLLNGELEGYTTKLFMVMIGTNNRGRPADVAAGVKRIVAILREKHPEAKVLLLPIFPRGKTAQDANRARNEQVNAIIKNYADGQNVLWLDFNAKFLEPDGSISQEMMKDYLHPGVKGYEIWRDAVRPVFRAVVGK